MPWRLPVRHLVGVAVTALFLVVLPGTHPLPSALAVGASPADAAVPTIARPTTIASARAVADAPPRAPVHYIPPVDAPVVERFRPPASRYGPGNRGIDYDTTPGQPVRAAADGTVVFAGRVGFGRHVTVLHADGLRTSYSFLADVLVRRGDRVAQGDTVGSAGERLHVGVRAGAAYLDPLAVFGQRTAGRARLVADPGVDEEGVTRFVLCLRQRRCSVASTWSWPTWRPPSRSTDVWGSRSRTERKASPM